MKRKRFLLLPLLFSAVLFTVQGQTLLPRPEPSRLVNDFAGILSSGELQALENKLVAFDDSTSNQIVL
jgi:uncharacterized protein